MEDDSNIVWLNKVRRNEDGFEDYIVNISDTLRKRMAIDPYIISLDMVKEDIKQKLGDFIIEIEKVLEQWKKTPLTEFQIIASPTDPHWDRRVKEELRIFSELEERYKILYGEPVQFKDLKPVNKRKTMFKCVYYDPSAGRYKEMEIRIPARYPYVRPLSSVDDFGNMCLRGSKGGLEGLWRSDGRYGIAHFLAYIIGPLLSILYAKNRR